MSDNNGGRPIRPVILAGGAGTRLWPLSTAARPKHLLPLLGEDTLFQQTLDRFGDGFDPPIIVANQAQEAELRAAAPEGSRLLLEPMKRDSAAAIALAAELANGDELLLVCPSDHHIADVAAFHRAIDAGCTGGGGGQDRDLRDRARPSRDRLRLYRGRARARASGPSLRFVEKPPLEKAEAMLARGRALLECRHLPRFGQDLARGVGASCPGDPRGRARARWRMRPLKDTLIRVDQEAFAGIARQVDRLCGDGA